MKDNGDSYLFQKKLNLILGLVILLEYNRLKLIDVLLKFRSKIMGTFKGLNLKNTHM